MHMVFPHIAHASTTLPAVYTPSVPLLLHRIRCSLSVPLHMCEIMYVCVCAGEQKRERERRGGASMGRCKKMHYVNVRPHARIQLNGIHSQDFVWESEPNRM